ncbi:MAG: oligosaccharide flippase family protein [Solirubrobacteraceae bacterium]|nr:oligosaccharide flippase family protein [Solirubrobacteraceae bacterium]
MEDKARRALPLSLLSFGANKVITVGTTIVLARLLDPTEFGLFALAIMMLALLSMFNDFGFGRLLIARQDLDAVAKGTMLTAMVATSALLGLALAAVSSPIAGLFDEPRLQSLLVIIAVTLALSGPVWFYDTLLQRELEFKARLVAQVVQNIAFAAVAIGLVLLDHGVTGLVVANVASYVAYLACLLWVAPYHVRPAFARGRIGELLVGSRGFVVQGGVLFAQQNADNLTVAKVLGSGPLGAYFLAYRLAQLTTEGIARPVANVTFSAFSRMRHRGEDWGAAYLSTLRMIALAACPVAFVVGAAADPVVRLLYGPKWLVMIGPLAILGLWAILHALEWTVMSLLNTIGEADVAAAAATAAIVLLVPLLVLGAETGGLNGVAWVLTGHSAAMTIVLATLVARRGGVALRDQWAAVRTILLAGAVGWGVTRLITGATAQAPAVLGVLAAGAAGLAAYYAAISLALPGLLGHALRQARETVRRPAMRA